MRVKLEEGSLSPATGRMIPVIEMTLVRSSACQILFLTHFLPSGPGDKNENIRTRRLERGAKIVLLALTSSSGCELSDEDYEQRTSPRPRGRKRVKLEDDSDTGVKKVFIAMSFTLSITDQIIQKLRKRRSPKMAVKDEEEDFKIKEKDREQKRRNVKPKFEDEKKGLKPDVKKAMLAHLPPYVIPKSISREHLGKHVTRPSLTWGFGAQRQHMGDPFDFP